MATTTRYKSELYGLTLPDEVGGDFDRERDILTERPRIGYEEPPSEEDETEVSDPPTTISDARKEVENLIAQYKSIEQLADLTQERIDQKVGNYTIQLDPNKDYLVISAIKRSFPEAVDPTKISYEMYKQCLARSKVNLSQIPLMTPADILAAQDDPFRTDFNGLGSTPGLNREEIASPASVISPLNMEDFVEAAVKQIFEMLKDLQIKLIKKIVIPASIA